MCDLVWTSTREAGTEGTTREMHIDRTDSEAGAGAGVVVETGIVMTYETAVATATETATTTETRTETGITTANMLASEMTIETRTQGGGNVADRASVLGGTGTTVTGAIANMTSGDARTANGATPCQNGPAGEEAILGLIATPHRARLRPSQLRKTPMKRKRGGEGEDVERSALSLIHI